MPGNSFDPKTSVSELFAILRQWVPQVQQNIDIIGNEILKRGCNVNDRDGLTDMTLYIIPANLELMVLVMWKQL